ncbi:MAG: PfkB family carbohydrate kinase [Candidatus Krumholzibacteria bacterium]|nr:PfkB family carbohydrate kinase [Candidatus Krumholzibacteria bacterium]
MKRRVYDLEKMRSVVHGWKGKRVVVLGDVILDEFILGRANRVSREAPVVIVRYDKSIYSPGGAANAAQNIAALGGIAIPVAVIGDDESGSRLCGLLREMGVTTRNLIATRGLLTTTKTRIMAGDFHAQRQQVVRIDREQDGSIPQPLENRLLAIFERELARADAVLMSDYHQLLFTRRIIGNSIAMCRAARVPVMVDSRFRLNDFSGLTIATPNEVEAAHAAGIDLSRGESLDRIGRRLLKRLSARAILVTRGKFGMTLFERGKRSLSVDVVGSMEATDVTGAGDTVAAAVSLTVAAGHTMPLAMTCANCAASIVVMKRGTAVASPAEILEVMERLELDERSPRD